MPLQLEARNASLQDLSKLLEAQQARKIDVVIPSQDLKFRDGILYVDGIAEDPDGSPSGVITGRYRLSDTFIGGLASRLDVPPAWLRKQHTVRPDVFDQVANRLLHGATISRSGAPKVEYPADKRLHLLRAFDGRDDDGLGIARALASNSFQKVDHLDVLMAALEGARESGVEVEVVGADLTEHRMTVKLAAPSIQALAPELLANYRDPFTGRLGKDYPVVFAGAIITNSETGGGKWRLVPRVVFEVCTNGQVMQVDAFEGTHLGARLDAGVVKWSATTQTKNVELIKSQAKDTMATFLNVDYVQKAIRRLSEKAGVPVKDAEATIQHVATKLAYTEEQRKGILDHFIKGGQLTAGGVMNAITSYAQVEENPDASNELEGKAFEAMQLVAAMPKSS